jgi:hypothetical protein
VRRHYQIVVACAYIALVALVVCVLKMPVAWRIGLLIIAGSCVAYSVSASTEAAAGTTFPLSEDSKHNL